MEFNKCSHYAYSIKIAHYLEFNNSSAPLPDPIPNTSSNNSSNKETNTCADNICAGNICADVAHYAYSINSAHYALEFNECSHYAYSIDFAYSIKSAHYLEFNNSSAHYALEFNDYASNTNANNTCAAYSINSAHYLEFNECSQYASNTNANNTCADNICADAASDIYGANILSYGTSNLCPNLC